YPTLDALAGVWFVTSQVDGREAVGWACGKHPDSFEFVEGHVLVGVGAQAYGGAVASSAGAGATLVLHTTMEACRTSKDITVKWADPTHRVIEVARCVGTPRVVRAVRDLAANVAVVRQCCDPTGKALKYVGLDEPCPPGSTGEKPTPLRR
ncbi:MAG: hypothetical protein ABMB14_40480, partial [Myxococcota bacterium]